VKHHVQGNCPAVSIGHLLKEQMHRHHGRGDNTAKGVSSRQTRLTAKNVVANRRASANGLEADGDLVWTYRAALEPVRMPKKVAGHRIGRLALNCKLYNTLGADTTVVEVMDRVLPVEDVEISAFAKKAFVKQGMEIMEKAMVKSLIKSRKVGPHRGRQGRRGTPTPSFRCRYHNV
jgi:dihydrolipoamide dehydrogenase